MKYLFGKCGANCCHHPAYKENAETVEAGQRCRDGWSFGSKAGDLVVLESFESQAARLDEKCDQKAFRYFPNVRHSGPKQSLTHIGEKFPRPYFLANA